MKVYTGTDNIHDRMDKDAKAEEAYNSFEKKVLREMRPNDIPVMLWRAIWWGYSPSRKDRSQAVRDAKEMANDTGEVTVVINSIDGSYYATPEISFYECLPSSKELIYNFKIRLIKEGCFPDISNYAREAGEFTFRFEAHQKKKIQNYKNMAESNFKPDFNSF